MSARRPARAATVALLGLLPALLGWAGWRLERDQPLWRRPDLWRVHRPRVDPGRLPRLLLAVHYPWYGNPDGPAAGYRHWNHRRMQMPRGEILGFHTPRTPPAGGSGLGATNDPASGAYDSAAPAVIRAQLAQARQAGLDGFVVSWWGAESLEARVYAALLREARHSDIRLAPYYEAGELWRRGGAGVAADLECLIDQARGEPAWLAVGDTPVVFVYAAHRLRPRVWDYVLRRLQTGGRRVFLVGDSAHPAWLTRFDALHVYTPAVALARGQDLLRLYGRLASLAAGAGVPFVPAVAPGYDDRAIRTPATVVPRAGGVTYDLTWRAALAVDPSWVLVSTWNEWHEGSEIEPSREHGVRDLEATRRWHDAWRRADGAP